MSVYCSVATLPPRRKEEGEACGLQEGAPRWGAFPGRKTGQYIIGYRWRIHRRSENRWLKGGEGGNSGFSDRLPSEPGVNPGDIEGDGGEDVLKPGLDQTNVAAPPESEAANGLR
jgi:hypothetical protein